MRTCRPQTAAHGKCISRAHRPFASACITIRFMSRVQSPPLCPCASAPSGDLALNCPATGGTSAPRSLRPRGLCALHAHRARPCLPHWSLALPTVAGLAPCETPELAGGSRGLQLHLLAGLTRPHIGERALADCAAPKTLKRQSRLRSSVGARRGRGTRPP